MTSEDFRSAVFQLISNNCQPGRGLKASVLGGLIPRSTGDSWNQHGYSRLKDLLQEFATRGQIRLENDAKGALAVWLDAEPQTTARAIPVPTSLRKEVWLAFVAPSPKGRRFLNRENGAVRMGLTEPPIPLEQWVEIVQIPESEQRRWADEFLEEHRGDNHFISPDLLRSPTWYIDLARRLKTIDVSLASQWQRKRSSLVAVEVQKWSLAHAVRPELVFEQREFRGPEIAEGPLRKSASLSGPRQQILQALARMPTSELADLPIPAKYLLATNEKRPGK